MEFRLDDARVELQRTVAQFATARFPLESIVAREGESIDGATWRELASLGLFGLLLPEDAGGSGLDVVDAAIVCEQLGSQLVSGPLLWTMLAASIVEGAASGDARVGGIEASRIEDGAALVEHAAELDVLLVLDASGIVAHRTRDLPRPASLSSLDPSTPVGRFDGLASGARAGERVGGPAEADALRLEGRVLCAAMLSGVASRALEVARAHALERRQFDAPIGSFQAVKHMLADMLVRSDLAQSATYAAAAIVRDPDRAAADHSAEHAASAAKLLAGDAALENARVAIQLLGGMGFTWEMLPNHLLKRAWLLERSFGSADEHARQLGWMLGADTRDTREVRAAGAVRS